MKKIILKVVIASASILSSTECLNAQKGLQLGAEGTPQMSWIMNKDDNDNSKFEYENTINSSFGITGEYGFTNNIGIAINGLYSFQGQRFKINGVEHVKKIEYVKIPLMLAINYNIGSNLCFIGKIGPQLGLLTNAKFTDKDGNELANNQTSYMDYDIGGVAYAGIGYKVNDNLSIHANLRFDYAFTDAEDKDNKLDVNNPLITPSTQNGGNGSYTATISQIDSRAIANNMTTGLSFGFRYLLKAKQ